jgi:hypothetical protein
LEAKWATLEAQYKVTEERLGGDIERIEGIGPAFGPHLRSVGIAWVADLIDHVALRTDARSGGEDWLDYCAIVDVDKHGRLAAHSGNDTGLGGTPPCSRVDSVKELKHRGAENLRQKMEEVNVTAERKISPTVPDVMTVNDGCSVH